MSKSSRFNSSRIILPTLALAVVGMAAMVGITSNQNKQFNLNSKAGSQKCVEYHTTFDSIDESFWSRTHVTNQNGTATIKDNDLVLFQPSHNRNSAVGLESQQGFLKGNFLLSATIANLIPDNDKGNSVVELSISNSDLDIYLPIRIINEQKQKYFFHSFGYRVYDPNKNFYIVKRELSPEFPLTIFIKRSGTNFEVGFSNPKSRNKNNEYKKVQELNNIGNEDLQFEIKVTSAKPNYPNATAIISNLDVVCN
jgi:hypothetical protein